MSASAPHGPGKPKGPGAAQAASTPSGGIPLAARLLRTVGVSVNSIGLWYNDRSGSTHLWVWPWRRKGGSS